MSGNTTKHGAPASHPHPLNASLCGLSLEGFGWDAPEPSSPTKKRNHLKQNIVVDKKLCGTSTCASSVTHLVLLATYRAMDRQRWWSGGWQWWRARHRRPNRTATERRAQAPRAQARAVQQLLSGIAHLQSHRGGRPTLLGAALARALASEPPDAASDDASCEHGDDRSSSDCQPDEATRAAAQAHLAAFRAEHAAAAAEADAAAAQRHAADAAHAEQAAGMTTAEPTPAVEVEPVEATPARETAATAPGAPTPAASSPGAPSGRKQQPEGAAERATAAALAKAKERRRARPDEISRLGNQPSWR